MLLATVGMAAIAAAVLRRDNHRAPTACAVEPVNAGFGGIVRAQFSFVGECTATPLLRADASAGRSSSVARHLLMPKQVKFKKPHRPAVKPFPCNSWKYKGYANAYEGYKPVYGKYAMQTMEEGWMTSAQIEQCRRRIVRVMERKGKLWIRVFPTQAITKRVAESRMGAGKGSIEYWVAAVRPGTILFELDGITEEAARLAIFHATYHVGFKAVHLHQEGRWTFCL